MKKCNRKCYIKLDRCQKLFHNNCAMSFKKIIGGCVYREFLSSRKFSLVESEGFPSLLLIYYLYYLKPNIIYYQYMENSISP